MKTLRIGLFAALALGPGNCIAQNLLTNGSFELVAYPSNNITSLFPGTTSLPGWVLQGAGSIFIVTAPATGAFTPVDGKQFLDFNEDTLMLSQSFRTEPGGIYEVAFSAGYLGGRTNMQIIAQVFSTNNTLLAALTAPVPGPFPSPPWVPYHFRFAATTPISTLQFHSTNATPNVDLAMDAVSVQQIARGLTIDVAQIRLCWSSETNRTYQLQYSTNLAANAWTDLGAPIPGIGGIDCRFQQVVDPQRSYRVVLLP